MIILVIVRILIKPTTEDGSALLALQKPFYPVTWSAIPGVADSAKTAASV